MLKRNKVNRFCIDLNEFCVLYVRKEMIIKAMAIRTLKEWIKYYIFKHTKMKKLPLTIFFTQIKCNIFEKKWGFDSSEKIKLVADKYFVAFYYVKIKILILSLDFLCWFCCCCYIDPSKIRIFILSSYNLLTLVVYDRWTKNAVQFFNLS